MTDQRYVLVAVETAHIQSYIFASNHLKENVGASYLVAAATGEWALEALKAMPIRTNLASVAEGPFNNLHIEDSQLDVEVLYSGGGNIVLLFAETGFAGEKIGENRLPKNALSRQFIRHLSRKAQAEAPGLSLTYSAIPFEWENALSLAVSELLQNMKQQRSYQPALRGDAGQSVQIMDVSTSLPTITMEKETRRDDDSSPNPCKPYATETVAKRNAATAANALLRSALDLGQTDYRFALDLDDLGRSKDDTSYIAVVHADGNGLGRLIQGLQEKFPVGKNRDYVDYMRWFSEGVKWVAREAQREMMALLVNSIDERDGQRYLVGVGSQTEAIQLKQDKDNQYIFPIRPLVSGGDDVTFVCDSRIGLDLAVIFLRAFEKYTSSALRMPLTACAGVAIVKTHYPFARAYALADELAGNAKQARSLLDDENAPSALDWHITAGGLYGDLETMREREYQVADGSLTLRPIFVELPSEHPLYSRSWPVIQRIITEFQTRWHGHQNKAEGLRDVLRKGEVETTVYKVRYLTKSQAAWSKGKAPYLPEVGGFESNGWQNGYCGYYDALELINKYLPLQTQEATHP